MWLLIGRGAVACAGPDSLRDPPLSPIRKRKDLPAHITVVIPDQKGAREFVMHTWLGREAERVEKPSLGTAICGASIDAGEVEFAGQGL